MPKLVILDRSGSLCCSVFLTVQAVMAVQAAQFIFVVLGI